MYTVYDCSVDMALRVSLEPSLGRWVTCLVAVIACDALVFSAVGARVYPALEVDWRYAVLAYAVLAGALSSIVVPTPRSAPLVGGLVGAVVYGVFNGTEMAIRPDWRRVKTPLFDTLYGTVLCAGVATLNQRLL